MKSISKIAEHLDINTEKAKKVRGLIDGSIAPEDFESVNTWARQCYNNPSKVEKTMIALNEVIEGYGVEGMPKDGQHDSLFEYVNMGDTDNATIVYYNGKYLFTTWGDLVEKLSVKKGSGHIY